MHRDRVLEKALLRLAESRGIDIDRLCEDSVGAALLGSHDGWRIAEAEEAIDVAALDLDEGDAEDEAPCGGAGRERHGVAADRLRQ